MIAESLDERHGTPGLFPDTPAARARARWIEEFADTRTGDVFIWRLFNAAVIAPSVWKQGATTTRSRERSATTCRL